MNKATLQQLSIKISSGLTPLRSSDEFWDSPDIPWVKTEQLGKKNLYDSKEKISQKALDNTGLKLYPKNTLSVAMYGEGKTRGSVSILKKEMTTNQACCNIELDEKKADYEYVYYYLTTQYNQLRNLSSGVRKNLNSNDIKNFEIRIPEKLEDQRKIASVLSSLDAKIELNNRINTELEQMAKTLYDYWFVQFDFPFDFAQGKPNEQGKPYKSSGGKMVYNAELKREIPEGWEVKNLDKYGEFKNGINYDPKEQGDTFCKIINVRDISSSSVFISNDDLEELNLKSNEVIKYLVTNNSILIARSGIPGATRLIADFSQNTIYCGFIICFNVHDLKYKYPLFFHMKNIEAAMSSQSGGTIMKNVSQGTLKNIKVVFPKEDLIVNNFNELLNPIFLKLNLIAKENQELASLRDWLLPMLMNGQITVKEAEEKLDMAAEPNVEYAKK
jgi:type I restriction enzyme, S subunit